MILAEPAARGLLESLMGHAGDGEQVFLVLDGAASPEILPTLRDSGCEHVCLLKGRLPPRLARAAPYLVRLDPGAALGEWFVQRGWRRSWGVALTTAAPLAEVSRHLRRLLRAKTEDGRACTFRFYDPRVLAAYLPTCTPSELATVFGPAQMFLTESFCVDRWVELRYEDGGLVQVHEALPRLLAATSGRGSPLSRAPLPELAFLAAHYPSPRATEGLWVAAGGAPRELPRSGSASARWSSLWQRAEGDGLRAPLLRTALGDFPDSAPLLAALREAARPSAELVAGAGELVDALELRAPLEPEPLGQLLLQLPAAPAEALFAALATALSGRVPGQRRAALAPLLAELGLRAEVHTALSALLAELRASDAAEPGATRDQVGAVLDRLVASAHRAGGSGAAAAVAHVAQVVTAGRERLAARRSPSVASLRAMALSLTVSLRATEVPEPSRLRQVASELEAALAVTRGAVA